MDYSGLGKRNRFKVNFSVSEFEKTKVFYKNGAGFSSSAAKPMDFLSVIKMNSTYIDLVDRWYPVRGFWAWLSIIIGVLSLIGAGALIYAIFFPIGDPIVKETGVAIFLSLLVVGLLFFAWLGPWYAFKVECRGYTHYPIRLNRKTRKVHFYRQDGTVLTVPWDSLFITLGEAKSPIAGTTYDLRAHVLGSDGETVIESFSLGYTFPGNKESMDKFWAFLEPYMEAEDGVVGTYRILEKSLLMPLDNRREGWRWSLAQSYSWSAHWPWLQLIGSPVLGLNAVGRMIAMWSCKVPRWPSEVERESTIDADDPYVLTWRDNGPLGWWELWYPLICTVCGVGTAIGIIGWMFYSI